MIDLGKHALFIWASYGAVLTVIAGLIAWLLIDGRRQSKQLADLQARGVRRRSGANTTDAAK
ncbi:MAG: heme exporter protein CcmD [Hyphomicrobiaceae bacterium]